MKKEKSKIEEKIEALVGQLPDSIIKDLQVAAIDLKLTEKELDQVIEEVTKAYERAVVEPAEAVGIIAAQSIGEPSTQMSLDYDEKILVKQEGEMIPIEIGKFVDHLMEKFGYVKEKNSEILDIANDRNFFVYSLDQDEKLKLKRIKSVIRHKSPKKLLKIKTASGRKIIATDHHSFIIRNNNKIIPISGKQLKVGDRIPAIKFLQENCISKIQVSSILGTENLVKIGNHIYPYIAHSKGLPDRLKLSSSLGWLIGAYLSEGNCAKYFVDISNTEENFNQKVRTFAKQFQITINEYDNRRGFSTGHDFHINSSLLVNFLKLTCGSGSRNKKVPSFAFSAKDDFVRALLQSYFDGDGSITLDRKGIKVSSKSRELINGIALLLARFGIFCSKSDDGYWLWIPYKYTQLFLEKIGTSINGRYLLLKKLADKYKKLAKTAEYTDMIPGIGSLLFDIAKKLRYPTRCVNNFTKRQRIGRGTLKKYLEKFEEIAKIKNVDISAETNILWRALDSDVVWDKIEEISYVNPTNKYVYDISVEGLETFTTFDGIVTHNTMRTFHYAGVAEINVTLGLPRLIEIVDARKTPSTPMMTIYLEENISKSLEKARKVAKEIERVTISDLAKNIEIDFSEFKVVIELDEGRLKEYELTVNDVVKYIEKTFEESVHHRVNRISIKLKKATAQEMRRLVTKIKETRLRGIEGIKRIVLRKEGEEYVIYTEGSNLAAVLKIPGIDNFRTYTNDINENEEVLGIEAARNAIIQEAIKTLDEQGLTVDLRHIMLVADMMTVDGTVKAIGRHGVSGEKASVLARASFEVTVDHLLNASLRGESDNLTGVIENVIVGQPVSLGTGTIELVMRQARAK